MDKTFCCEASRLAWEEYKNNPHNIGILSLYLNLEYDFMRVDEIIDYYDQDQGLEL